MIERMRLMSETPIDKAWRTRRVRKAAETRRKNVLHTRLSKVAKREVRKRRQIQDLVAEHLKKWWKQEYLEGPPSSTEPLKCIVCGESEKLGLAIHHIDPRIKKNGKNRNVLENKAPLCGTCHNIITYKKTGNVDEIVKAIEARHGEALKRGSLRQ